MPVPAPGWVFLTISCIFLPCLALWANFRIQRGTAQPDRARLLVSIIATQAPLLLLAFSAATYCAITLFPRPAPSVRDALVAAGFLAVTLGTLPWRWRSKSAADRQRTLWLLPRSPRDYWWWALVALFAGFSEEIVYRGVMFTLWQRILGGWWLPAGVCILAFAIIHAIQGWRSMLAIAAIALGFHAIVRLTGDLYTAMIVHAAYDFAAGIILLSLSRRDDPPSS